MKEEMNRRTFLTGVCAALAVGVTGALPAAANSAVKKLSGGRLSVRLSAVPELAKVGGAVSIGSVKGVPTAIARISATKYTAFSLACPHQGVTVTRDTAGWRCSAHGSEFDPAGGLVMGPATSSLRSIPIKVKAGVATVG